MIKTLASSQRLDRQQRHEAFWQGRKRKFFLAIGLLSFLLQLLFLGNMAYLYGSLWKSTARYHNFKVLYVDYDGGVIGQAVDFAYQKLRGPGFPTLVQRDKSEYSSMDAVIGAVSDTTYWAAFITKANASDQLALALQDGKFAQQYDPTGALGYVWNEVRYPPFSDEIFLGSFTQLVAATRLAYNKLNGTAALGLLDREDSAALQVLLDPIATTSLNLMPTPQQTKLFFNTVSMVMPILMQFFFLLILNGISREFQLYSRLPLHISGLVRAGLSVVFDLIAALCMSGYIWAFREDWGVTGKHFALTWMVLWLLMHIHFLIIDFCTAILPLPALPFFLLTWIIINITSSISPFESNPGFYRWGYALPTNEVYTVLTDIWSSGNVPQLHRALPIVFSWWIGGIKLACVGHGIRCHKAWKQDEKLDDLARTASQGKSEGQESSDNTAAVARSPSETLLEAAEAYRSAYGPSVSPPYGWFGNSEAPNVNPESSQPKEQGEPGTDGAREEIPPEAPNVLAGDRSRVEQVEGTPDEDS